MRQECSVGFEVCVCFGASVGVINVDRDEVSRGRNR